MKPTALFVNVARGEVVDEDGLVRALGKGKIAGAALDVRKKEPPQVGPLCQMDNVILTPHIAGFTHEAQHRVVAAPESRRGRGAGRRPGDLLRELPASPAQRRQELKRMAAMTYALLTVLSSAAFTLVLRGAMQVWPIGLAGVLSRCVTLPLLGGWILTRGEGWPAPSRRHAAFADADGRDLDSGEFALVRLAQADHGHQRDDADAHRSGVCGVLGTLLGLERITPGELALVPVFLAGMALLTGVADSGWSAHLLGDLMAVGATFFYAVNAFQIRTILREMDEEAVAFYNHGLSTLGFVTMAIACDEFSTALPAMSMASAWWWIVGVGVTAAVSLPLYYAALRRLPVWKLRAWLLLSPVLVAIVEWLWGVRLSLSQWLGAAMVLGGLAALIRMEWARRSGPSRRRGRQAGNVPSKRWTVIVT